MDFNGIRSLNNLQWYDLFFEDMEANSTLFLITKRKWLKLLIGFIENRENFLTHFLKNKSYRLNVFRHTWHFISLEYKYPSDIKIEYKYKLNLYFFILQKYVFNGGFRRYVLFYQNKGHLHFENHVPRDLKPFTHVFQCNVSFIICEYCYIFFLTDNKKP